MMDNYSYTATIASPEHNTWMVHRIDAHGRLTEALLRVDTINPEVAIEAAIERGSWA